MFQGLRELPEQLHGQVKGIEAYQADYSFFEIPIHLTSNSEEFFRHFDLFFGGFRCREPDPKNASFQVWIDRGDIRSCDEHRLYRDRELIYKTPDYIDIFLFLEWQICGMITRSDRYLLMHAGLSAREGEGILIAGPSGAGKSTLVGGLALLGYDYITDEMVIVDPGTGKILPFARTLNVKEEAFSGSPALLPLLRGKCYGQQRPYLGGRWFVEAGPGNGISRIRTVLFPRYEAGAETAIEPISRGRGIFRLTENTFNLPHFGEQGIDLLIHLTQDARFFSMTNGNLEAALRITEETCRHPAPKKAIH